MAGMISVMSSNGDDELKLPDDKAEAKKKVDELLDKSYSIFVTKESGEGDAKTKDSLKVSGYDEATGEYIVKQGEKPDLRINAATANATAVAPVAGG